MDSTSAADFPSEITAQPFPARTRTASSVVNGVSTQVMSVSFADRILVTISQGGRLSQWVHVPLETAAPDPSMAPPLVNGEEADENVELLPMAHLTATTVLGGTIPERNALGQLYATQIASAIATRDPAERRTVVVGLGLERAKTDKKEFGDILELVLSCI